MTAYWVALIALIAWGLVVAFAVVLWFDNGRRKIARIVDEGRLTRHFPPKFPDQSTTPLDEHTGTALAILQPDSELLPAEEA